MSLPFHFTEPKKKRLKRVYFKGSESSQESVDELFFESHQERQLVSKGKFS